MKMRPRVYSVYLDDIFWKKLIEMHFPKLSGAYGFQFGKLGLFHVVVPYLCL